MKKVLAFVLCIALCFIVAGCSGDSYNQNLYEFTEATFVSAYGAEDVGNVIVSVWHDAIYEEWGATSFMFTMIPDSKVFYSDFNTALGKYFKDSHYINIVDVIDSNMAPVDAMYSELKNPPKNCEDGYEIAQTLYSSYEKLVNAVKNPTGSLQTFSSTFNEAHGNYVNAYEKMSRYFENQGFEKPEDPKYTVDKIKEFDEEFIKRAEALMGIED